MGLNDDFCAFNTLRCWVNSGSGCRGYPRFSIIVSGFNPIESMGNGLFEISAGSNRIALSAVVWTGLCSCSTTVDSLVSDSLSSGSPVGISGTGFSSFSGSANANVAPKMLTQHCPSNVLQYCPHNFP